MSDQSDFSKRVFIGGLNYETTDLSLKQHFEQWGEVTSHHIVRFPDSGDSKGFGFVTFKEAYMVDNSMDTTHTIDDKKVDLRRVTAKETSSGRDEGKKARAGKTSESVDPRRIFIGGLDYETTDYKLREYFEKFGEVTQHNVVRFDSGDSRGFGFVTFKDASMVDECMKMPGSHQIDGKTVDLKRVTSKEEARDGGRRVDEEEKFDPESKQMRKLFVGGMGYDITEDDLKSYFEKFGTLVETRVVKFPDSGKSRGFGFVMFEKAASVDECQKERPHKLDGKSVETKRVTPKGDGMKGEAHITVKKIFIGGLRDDIEDEDLEEYFGKFGKVEKVEQPRKPDSGKKRGFGFVEFEDSDTVDKIVLMPRFHQIGNRKLEVKKVLSKEQQEKAAAMEKMAGGMGNMSGGMGNMGSGMGSMGGGMSNMSGGMGNMGYGMGNMMGGMGNMSGGGGNMGSGMGNMGGGMGNMAGGMGNMGSGMGNNSGGMGNMRGMAMGGGMGGFMGSGMGSSGGGMVGNYRSGMGGNMNGGMGGNMGGNMRANMGNLGARDSSSGDSSNRLFVGGLNYETTDNTLKKYFEQFGRVTHHNIVRFAETGDSRGFGFVTFSHPMMVQDCLNAGPHKIYGNTVELREVKDKDGKAKEGGEKNKSMEGRSGATAGMSGSMAGRNGGMGTMGGGMGSMAGGMSSTGGMGTMGGGMGNMGGGMGNPGSGMRNTGGGMGNMGGEMGNPGSGMGNMGGGGMGHICSGGNWCGGGFGNICGHDKKVGGGMAAANIGGGMAAANMGGTGGIMKQDRSGREGPYSRMGQSKWTPRT